MNGGINAFMDIKPKILPEDSLSEKLMLLVEDMNAKFGFRSSNLLTDKTN